MLIFDGVFFGFIFYFFMYDGKGFKIPIPFLYFSFLKGEINRKNWTAFIIVLSLKFKLIRFSLLVALRVILNP